MSSGTASTTGQHRQTSNANMAWSGDCAYVAGSGGLFAFLSPTSSIRFPPGSRT